MSAILSEAVQRRRKRGVEFPTDFGLHAPRSLFGPIHPCCSVRVLIVHRVLACLRCVGWMAGDSAATAARVLTARRPPVRPFVVVGGGGGGLGSGASLHDQLKVASQAPSLSASLSLKPLQSIAVASWRVGVEWMGGWGRGREGARVDH